MNNTFSISLAHDAPERPFQSKSPALVFDLRELHTQAEAICKAGEEANVAVLLAVKAVPHPAALAVLAPLIHGFDVSNAREFAAIQAYATNKLVSFTGPICTLGLRDLNLKSVSEVVVNAETESQLRLALSLERGNVAPGIRIRSSDWTSLEPPFGFDDSLLLNGALILDYSKIRAAHIHGGGRSNSPRILLSRAEKTLVTLKALGIRADYINFGGGVTALSEAELREYLMTLVALSNNRAKVLVEPGEYFFSTCGWAEGTVIDVSITREGVRAIVDLSAVAHLRWSLFDGYCEVSSSPEPGMCRVEFIGPSCHRGDLLGRIDVRRSIERPLGVRPGDKIRLDGITSYSAAWNIGFAGIEPAAVFAIH